MYLAGTIAFHWKERKVVQLQRALSTIYKEHGPPRVLQHDQGREFDGAVNKLCKKLGIKVIKGRPYHPQSQGEKLRRSFLGNVDLKIIMGASLLGKTSYQELRLHKKGILRGKRVRK